jgi:hypothetical protein
LQSLVPLATVCIRQFSVLRLTSTQALLLAPSCSSHMPFSLVVTHSRYTPDGRPVTSTD